MKVVIELNKEPNTDDILIWNGNEWIPTPQRSIVCKLQKRIDNLQDELQIILEDYQKLKENVNKKLKDYHDILQIISKGE